MKFGTRDTSQKGFLKSILSKTSPTFNRNKVRFTIVVVSLIFFFIFVINMVLWTRLQRKVDVVVAARQIHQNELITADMFEKYSMIKAEYDRYALSEKNSIIQNRIVLWKDKEGIEGYYAAYAIRPNSFIEYKNLIGSIEDNSNLVRYSNPGKELLKLNIASSEVNSYKDQVKPGEKINILATYKDTLSTLVSGRGNSSGREMDVEVTKTDTVFNGLVIADIRNGQNKSVLDYISKFKELSVFEQSQIAGTDEYAKATAAESLFVCLTPSEVERLKLYESMSDVKFFITLPQLN